AQEVWAAALVTVSIGAWGLGIPALAVGAGVFALFFRELILPYCALAGVLSFWQRRWLEGLAWFVGIGLFFAYLFWHHAQVAEQLAQMGAGDGKSVAQWLTYPGIDFLLLTGRMTNVFLDSVPGG